MSDYDQLPISQQRQRLKELAIASNLRVHFN